jgi:glutamate-1-semialdehyde 2,1-aminomutase
MLGMQPESVAGGQELYDHARTRIPGGTQLLSKRPEQMAPGQWPAYFREARGYEVSDLDGRHFVDMWTNGIGACLLGYRDPDVTQAVKRRLTLGVMSSLNPPEEIGLADLLCEIHPWATRVRFARTGGESLAMAVRIARATTKRSVIAVCGYHGWHDWYLAANLGDSDRLRGHLLPGLEPSGVPSELRGTAHAFTYNSLHELQAIVREHGEQLAAVVMEPCRNHDPDPGFLEGVRAEVNRCGALLLFDEITIGWRLHYGGAHLKFGVDPDIAVFAKALGNGHPMAAVIGTESAMEGALDSFISSTYWTESVGPTAALATVQKMGTVDVPAHVTHIGSLVGDAWRAHGKKHNLPVHVSDAFACLAHFRFDHPQATALRTLYIQFMLDRGFLAGTAIYPTLAHDEGIVRKYDAAIDEVFAEIRRVLATDRIEAHLKGPIAHEGFRRLT